MLVIQYGIDFNLLYIWSIFKVKKLIMNIYWEFINDIH